MGLGWHRLDSPSPITKPASRGFAALTFDRARGITVLYGGAGRRHAVRRPLELPDDRCRNDHRVRQRVPGQRGNPDAEYGRGPATVAGRERRADARESPGDQRPLRRSGSARRRPAGRGSAYHLDLTFAGGTGCQVYAALEIAIAAPVLGGTATTSILVPANPSLLGQPLFAQGVVPDAVRLGIVLSNALDLRLGIR